MRPTRPGGSKLPLATTWIILVPMYLPDTYVLLMDASIPFLRTSRTAARACSGCGTCEQCEGLPPPNPQCAEVPGTCCYCPTRAGIPVRCWGIQSYKYEVRWNNYSSRFFGSVAWIEIQLMPSPTHLPLMFFLPIPPHDAASLTLPISLRLFEGRNMY